MSLARRNGESSRVSGRAALVLIIAVVVVVAPVAFTGVGTSTAANTATFEVSDLQSPAKVVVGDTLTVTATVTNTGDTAATKGVTLRFDRDGDGRVDFVKRAKGVQLEAGESTTVTLSSTISERQSGGTYAVGVFTPDDSETTTLKIIEPADFRLSDFEGPDVLPAGDTLNVSVTVENVGNVAGTKSLELRRDGVPIETRNVSLAPGESKRILLTETETSIFCCIANYPASERWNIDVVIRDQQQGTTERVGTGLLSVPGERILRIEGAGQYITYEITTNYAFLEGKQLEARDRISADNKSISGGVTGGADRYVIKGSILRVQTNGPDDAVTVVNGDETLVTSSYNDLDTVRFVGDGNGTRYAFTADGIVDGRGLGPADGFADERGSGFVSSGSDIYTFGGGLRSVSLPPGSNVRVLVDGEEVDPYALDRAQIVTFVGNGTSAEYAFTTDSSIVGQARIESGDDVGASSVNGVVRGGIDQFRYWGDIERLDVTEGITVYIDGEEVDPETIGEDG